MTNSKIIVVLFSLAIFLKYIGGNFHFINIGIPIILIICLASLEELNKKSLKISSYIVVFLIFTLYLFIETFFSNAPNYGDEKVISLLIIIVLAGLSRKHIIKHLDLFLKSNLFFFLVFVIAYILFYRSFGNVLAMLSIRGRLTMGSDVFDVIGASRYMGFNLINLFFLFFVLKFDLKNKKVIFIIAVIVVIFAMILFGTKGPLLSLILAPFLYFIFYYKKFSFKKILFVAIFISLLGYMLFNPDILIRMIPNKYQSYFQYRFFNYQGYENDRPTLYKMALRNIDQHSILFGKGTGNFGYLYTGHDEKMYPHNIFIEILYENGLIGLSILLFILFKPILDKDLNKKSIDSGGFFVIIIFYFLINAQVSGDISGNFNLFVFLIFLEYRNKLFKKIKRNLYVPTRLKNPNDFLNT